MPKYLAVINFYLGGWPMRLYLNYTVISWDWGHLSIPISHPQSQSQSLDNMLLCPTLTFNTKESIKTSQNRKLITQAIFTKLRFWIGETCKVEFGYSFGGQMTSDQLKGKEYDVKSPVLEFRRTTFSSLDLWKILMTSPMTKVKALAYVLTIIIPNLVCSPGCISSGSLCRPSHVASIKPALHPPPRLLQGLGAPVGHDQVGFPDVQVDARFLALALLSLARSR